ncbi:MAG: sigma-70 family RNA polymerase sigma factor [Candidatus Leucobacter sulfamidivorax]|nr:sigma-70 family RNA polymerase sigma factor [Candidatus Leucobacter sulfamidivorax]
MPSSSSRDAAAGRAAQKGRVLGREFRAPAVGGSSDAELLTLLRGGEADAYTELWRRHIQPALRFAGRLAPGRADDLASESFLAVYHQITVAGNGPESAFRAYLFTTMRNIAMRWRKETDLVETDPDLDSIELEDGLSALIDRNRSAEMLAAFQALPERWQRVLWLTEVEDVPRPEIAAEFGIKPNAVSVLYRRARTGLRLQWLAQQIPPALRESSEHVARLLPQLVVEGGSPDRRIAEHLRECGTCANLDRELRSSARGMQRTTLGALGFAALGVALRRPRSSRPPRSAPEPRPHCSRWAASRSPRAWARSSSSAHRRSCPPSSRPTRGRRLHPANPGAVPTPVPSRRGTRARTVPPLMRRGTPPPGRCSGAATPIPPFRR